MNLSFKVNFISVLLLNLPIQLHAACIPLIQKDPSIPIEITKAGYYCLAQDLVYRFFTNCAIEVKANHVVVDLKGHTLIGAPTEDVVGPTLGGICSRERRYITVRNGALRGFDSGVNLSISGNKPSYTTGHIVENLHINGRGSLSVDGDSNIIRNNRLIGSRKASGGGISTSGKRNWIIGNYLTEAGSIGGVGNYSVVEGNRIFGRGNGFGIGAGSAKGVTLINNVIGRYATGIALHSGILRDNIIISDVKEPYEFITSNITDGGGNIPPLPK